MRKHLEQLNKAKAEAEATYAKRIKTYDERTDNWRETYKAQLYKDRTEALDVLYTNLEDTIDSLETYLD